MSYKITGTVKFNQFSHEYALDLNVTETQPEQNVNQLATEPEEPKQARPEEPKLFHQEVYDYEETPEYTVEYQGRASGLWERSINYGLQETFPTIGEAEVSISLHKSVGMNYRIVDNNGVVVDLPYLTTPKPEVKPSIFIVEFEQSSGSKLWLRSTNPGLRNRTFATRAEAIEAMEEFGSTKQLTYRVTEVQQ